MKHQTLHETVDQLIQSQRVVIRIEEDGQKIRATVPSLLDQLEAATDSQGSVDGGKRMSSRPPMSFAVVDLLQKIEGVARDAVKRKHGKPAGGVRQNLRRLAADAANQPVDSEETQAWVRQIQSWITSARTILGVDPQMPKGIRGATCPECGTKTVNGKNEIGETVLEPVLQFAWSRETIHDPDKLAPDRTVRAVICQNCKQTWWAGQQFHDLTEKLEKHQ